LWLTFLPKTTYMCLSVNYLHTYKQTSWVLVAIKWFKLFKWLKWLKCQFFKLFFLTGISFVRKRRPKLIHQINSRDQLNEISAKNTAPFCFKSNRHNPWLWWHGTQEQYTYIAKEYFKFTLPLLSNIRKLWPKSIQQIEFKSEISCRKMMRRHRFPLKLKSN
jgi:hypothetical protein